MKAIRLLGKQPLDMEPEQWEVHCEAQEEIPDAESDAFFDRKLDRQLDDRLPENENATIAVLRSVGERAIARLEALAAGHRERAEAEAAQQVARLSFDPSNEGERLRRYQSSCSRSLFRSFDTLIKLRRSSSSGSGERDGGSGETARGDQLANTENGIPRFTAETNTERGDQGKEDFEPAVEAAGIVETTTENEATPATGDRPNPRNKRTRRSVSPSVDHGNRENEPMASSRPRRSRRSLVPGCRFTAIWSLR